MNFTTQAALIVAGIVAIIVGIFGGGFKIGPVVTEKIAGWKQAVLCIAGALLILLGVALTEETYKTWQIIIGSVVAPPPQLRRALGLKMAQQLQR